MTARENERQRVVQRMKANERDFYFRMKQLYN